MSIFSNIRWTLYPDTSFTFHGYYILMPVRLKLSYPNNPHCYTSACYSQLIVFILKSLILVTRYNITITVFSKLYAGLLVWH